ncbi:Heavy metal transport/detoxification protein [Rhynchospora pubera]|uniref:Heavy metal transport/detoxification protein n=1 Tax=Rhynchospora pubera TaxID=906938 RepID=A0AAV8CRT6_9POAL|nr:Heavy metal transport/detoxification protein [Rhynchospora pubera]
MKRKIVIEVQMHCAKCRSKALKIAASTDGVDSVTLEGDGKNRLVVTGNDVDSVNLTKTLRKKIGRAAIVEQGEVKKKEEEKKEKVDESMIQWWPSQPILVYDLPSNPNPGGCSIQ